jgi:hypothetical protein
MKKLFILLLLCSSVTFAQKDTFKKSLSGIKKVRIECDTDVTVVTGTASELLISEGKMVKDDNDNYHWRSKSRRKGRNADRAKGLTAIYPGGEDNTDGFGFTVSVENGVLTMKDLKSHFQRDDIKVTLPKNMDVDIHIVNLGSVKMEGFTSEVEVRTNVGEVDLIDVTGPITAHTSTGTVTVVFGTVNQSAPITITSATGEIDVALPSNTKANLSVGTIGTVYTNFNFKAPDKKGLPNRSGLKNIDKELNGGGVKIKLKSAMGNIYLRKK